MRLEDLDSDTRALLDRYGFDQAQFLALREKFLKGELGVDGNRLRGHVEAPHSGDLMRLPAPDSAERKRLAAIGINAMREGEVGCVVLAGGMATRFGGVVKAAVPALHGQTFLSIKLGGIRVTAEQNAAEVPAFVMTSFATDAEIRRLLPDLHSH